jgi:hypothetical protein
MRTEPLQDQAKQSIHSHEQHPDSHKCCVCGEAVVNVHRGGTGITVLYGQPPDNVRQAHLECAKKKDLPWFGM